MKIPFSFYFKHWLSTLLLALTTGALVGIFSFQTGFGIVYKYVNNITISIGLFFLYSQLISYRHFWGSQRGNFEFMFVENTFEKEIANSILRYFGYITYLRYKIDNYHSAGYFQFSMCDKLIQKSEIHSNLELYHLIFVKMAHLSYKDGNYSKGLNFLQKAIELKEDSLIANFRFGVAQEKENEVEKAVRFYKKASTSQEITTKGIQNFIMDQIDRVQSKGPMIKPPMPGTRFNIR
ncbi:MAG: hypothetical protein HUN04_20730 [Desulfobacter sp.]|nr:MAG: hypothetical protein HUN04_20730 [Desulfobacter sp.]